MALADNKRLFDIATRQQLYVEGVKVWQAQQFDLFLRDLSEELRKLLPRIKYKKLDSLTKAQLSMFIIELRKTQSRLYSLYLEKLLKQLETFMRASVVVSKRIWTSELAQEELNEQEAEGYLSSNSKFAFLFGAAAVSVGGSATMWSRISNAPIPANGAYLLPFLKNFNTYASSSVENAVRKAYANGDSLEDLTSTIFARTAQGNSGILQKIARQAPATIATAMQHISQVVSAGITSGLYGRYRWYSVIDNSTTEICRSRNGNIYTYSEGPMPPAHNGCRSHIAPIGEDGEDAPDETFSKWLGRQPNKFLNDIGDEGKFIPTAIDNDEYLDKVPFILI